MHITPKRRRRCLKIHHLSMKGLSQRKIGEQLNVSHATVRSDLQLIETHWSDIAGPAADDLLLDQLHLLRQETSRIAGQNLLETFGKHITVAEYIKVCDARDAKVLAFIRETRRTIDAVQRRAGQREAQPDLYGEETETVPEPVETTPKLAETVQPESASPQPEQEIAVPDASEEKIPPETVQSLPDSLLDPLIEEARTLFPHLNGQSPDNILTFLDQLTDPTQEEAFIPYADAAG